MAIVSPGISIGVSGSPAVSRHTGTYSAAGADPAAALGVVAAAGWIALGWWYLTTPRVRPPGWMTTMGDPAGAAADWERNLTRALAVRSCLTGVFAARNVRRDVGLALLVAPFAWGALWLLSPAPAPVGAGAYMGGLCGVVLTGGLQAANAARRARWLWLLGGSRVDLFSARLRAEDALIGPALRITTLLEART